MTSRSAASVQEGYDYGGLWAAIVVLFAWHGLSAAATVVSAWLRYGFIASGAVVWLVYAALGGWSTWMVLHGGGRRLAWPLAVCILVLAGVVVVARVCHGGFFSRYNWAFSEAGWFALTALWRRRLSELLTFFVVNALVGAVMLIALHEASRVSMAEFTIGSVAVSVLQITIFVGGKTVAATARRGAEAEEDLAQTRIARLAAQAVEATRRVNYETIRSAVADLLDGLALGQLDLSDPAAYQRVAVAVGRLRRYLVEPDGVPDQLSHELDACADTAERGGIAVDLIAPVGVVPALPVGVRRALTDPIIQVLAATVTRARITVVASPVEVAVAIVADACLGTPVQARHNSVTVAQDTEGGLLWLQASWNSRSASPS